MYGIYARASDAAREVVKGYTSGMECAPYCFYGSKLWSFR